MLLVSYSLFFAGSLFHIISCNYYFNRSNNIPRFLYLIISRVFIGIGSMEVIGRKYIALYSPRFYLIKISKNYSIINFIGYAAGPLITLLLLLIPKSSNYEGFVNYNEFNCIGWYGVIASFILLIVNLILFTRQSADSFQMIRDEQNLNFAIKTSFHSDRDSRKEKSKKKLKKRKSNISNEDIDVIITKTDLIEGLIPDEIDEKKEKENKENDTINNKEEEKKEDEKKEDDKKDESPKAEEKKEEAKKDEILDVKEKKEEEKDDEVLNINNIEKEKRKNSEPKKKKKKKKNDDELGEKFSQSANDLIRVNIGSPSDLSICSNNLDTGLNSSQILSSKQKKMINSIESKLDEYNEKSNFTNINMIPKAIDLLIAKEKNTFGYLKTNILVSLLLIFFSNVIKSHTIVSFSYYLYEKKFFNEIYICMFLSIIYLMQIISLFFVLPLRKINVLIKKYFIIFLITTIIFMSPLLYAPILESKYLILLIASGTILLCSIIVILCSCYLSYLLPPGWKIFFIHAGRLPLCLIIFGKFVGFLISILNFDEKYNIYNIYTIFIITVLSYGSIIIYLFITSNFRIKVIARIMRKRVFENMGI